MKSIILLVLIILCGSVKAQTSKQALNPTRPLLTNIDSLKTDVVNIQNCLKHYHDERQYAYAFSLAGAGALVMSIKYGTNNNGKTNNIGYIASGVFSVLSVITFIDSEKWIKRASISISPTSLKINF